MPQAESPVSAASGLETVGPTPSGKLTGCLSSAVALLTSKSRGAARVGVAAKALDQQEDNDADLNHDHGQQGAIEIRHQWSRSRCVDHASAPARPPDTIPID